jgi:hypothetical protein
MEDVTFTFVQTENMAEEIKYQLNIKQFFNCGSR